MSCLEQDRPPLPPALHGTGLQWAQPWAACKSRKAARRGASAAGQPGPACSPHALVCTQGTCPPASAPLESCPNNVAASPEAVLAVPSASLVHLPASAGLFLPPADSSTAISFHVPFHCMGSFRPCPALMMPPGRARTQGRQFSVPSPSATGSPVLASQLNRISIHPPTSPCNRTCCLLLAYSLWNKHSQALEF